MAHIYASSFDQYGPGLGPGNATISVVSRYWDMSSTNIIGDGWAYDPTMGTPGATIRATGSLDLKAPSWGARKGSYALVADSMEGNFIGGANNSTPYTVQGTECLPLNIPGASLAHRIVQFAFGCSDLPTQDFFQGNICHFMNASGQVAFTLAVNPSGRLVLNGWGATTVDGFSHAATTAVNLATSAASLVSPNTWYNLGIDIVYSSGANTHTVNIYNGDIVPANLILSAVVTPSYAGNIDVLGLLPASFKGGLDSFGDTSQRAIRDLWIMDDTGTYNNALVGQVFVSAQETRTEDAGGGWSHWPRENFTAGVLDSYNQQEGCYVADAATYEIGASAFTAETEWRPSLLPTTTAGYESLIIGKWDEAGNQRSYRLTYDGPSAKLRWEVSTDGTTPLTIAEIPWVPDLNREYYHVAVARDAGVTRLFIDGVQQGVDVADANTYFNGTAPLSVAGRFEGTSTFIANTQLYGFLDETRLTIGVGRYIANFTPPTSAFGRNTTDDPSFASVALLMGYESGVISDESSHAAVVTAPGTAPVVAITPNDSANSYDVLNNRPAWDDTGFEAANTYAQGRFTFTALPTATETMTIGTKTYTWVATLAAANDILIGATAADCATNAIAAINAAAGAGTIYGTGTTANASASAIVLEGQQFDLQALTIGTTGNAVATTETMVAGSFAAATLTGGQDIPTYTQFSIERLPADATGVAAVQFSARAYKSDAGTAAFQIDLIGASAGVGAGTAINPDLNASWFRQAFETDPDTAVGLTPSTVISGRVRLNRTV